MEPWAYMGDHLASTAHLQPQNIHHNNPPFCPPMQLKNMPSSHPATSNVLHQYSPFQFSLPFAPSLATMPTYPPNDAPYSMPLVVSQKREPNTFLAHQNSSGNIALGIPLLETQSNTTAHSDGGNDDTPISNDNTNVPSQVSDNSAKKRKVRKFTE